MKLGGPHNHSGLFGEATNLLICRDLVFQLRLNWIITSFGLLQSVGSLEPTFRDYLLVPSSRVKSKERRILVLEGVKQRFLGLPYRALITHESHWSYHAGEWLLIAYLTNKSLKFTAFTKPHYWMPFRAHSLHSSYSHTKLLRLFSESSSHLLPRRPSDLFSWGFLTTTSFASLVCLTCFPWQVSHLQAPFSRATQSPVTGLPATETRVINEGFHTVGCPRKVSFRQDCCRSKTGRLTGDSRSTQLHGSL
jgi:hypothetical protein